VALSPADEACKDAVFACLRQLRWRPATVLVFMCSLFTTVATLVLVLFSLRGPIPGMDVPLSGLLLRLGLFGGLALLAGGLLWRYPQVAFPTDWVPPPSPRPTVRRTLLFLGLALLPALLLMLPNLDVYPWAAPDEMHHLGVAKNLAEYGRYASGSPEAGFKDFEPFDSVGPTVIVPIAAVFRMAGVSVQHARLVMAVYFLLFLVAVYFFAEGRWLPEYDSASAAVMATLAFSSVYLGRTLYGEVPAMAFLLLGNLAWQRALKSPRPVRWGLLAGFLLGLMVLTKTLFLLIVFPLATVWLLDWTSVRKIRWAHIWPPALAVLLVLSAWSVVQMQTGTTHDTTGNLLGLYASYLLFGLSPLPGNALYFLGYPWAHAVIFGMLLMWLIGLGILRIAPPIATLILFAWFVLFWWTFFTPGQIPRYLWPLYAIAGMFIGSHLVYCFGNARNTLMTRRMRAPFAVTLFVVLVPSVVWIVPQAHAVYTNREMQDDYEVAARVRALPEATVIATSFEPMRGTLRFLADREVAPWPDPARPTPAVMIALASALPGDLPAGYTKQDVVGRYVFLVATEGAPR
jgi:4-amino-4-deoxy-L-arabinose transferase-like glycosyltransferase